jgi:serine/threonine protein kinase
MFSFATRVKLGIDTETGERVAIKILEQTQLEALKMMEKVRREVWKFSKGFLERSLTSLQIRILKGIHHVNVVRLIEVMVSKTHLYIVLELIAGGELFSKLGMYCSMCPKST